MSMFTPAGTGAGRVRRARGRRRGLVALLALLVAAAAGAVTWYVATRPADEVVSRPEVTCPEPVPAPTVVPAATVRVNVYNATDRSGLAARAAAEMRRRGFRVATIGNDPLKRTVTGAAEVRHSAAGADAARTVAVHVGQVGPVVSVPDQRRRPTVDLVLGAAFRALLPTAEAAAALAPSPEPVPAGC